MKLLLLCLIAGGYFIKLNAYYGWNFEPKSDAELICDGLALILVAIAVKEVWP